MQFKLTKKEKSWILYDVGNSAFVLMVSTILPVYFNYLAQNAGVSDVDYLAYWGYAASISTLIVAVLGPVMGTLADTRGFKKPLFLSFILVGCAGCLLMGLTTWWISFLVIFIIAKVGFHSSLVFYDSMLSDVTTPERMDRVSSSGYAWGYAGSCIDRLSGRKAEMKEMNNAKNRTTMVFHIPARGLIGFRSEFIRMTRGEGIMYHTFLDYRPYAGDIPRQRNGSIIAHEQGEAIPYALAQYEDRGVFFVTPKTKVYRGMIIGECNKPQDIVVNICKTKKLTNMRSATADVMVTLQAHKEMSLEECMEYIGDDELVEITPENVRIRKADLTKKIYN